MRYCTYVQVYALVEAEDAANAVALLRDSLESAGFGPYDAHDSGSAVLSEHQDVEPDLPPDLRTFDKPAPTVVAPEPVRDFAAALQAFVDGAQAMIDAHQTKHFPNNTREVLKTEMGKRYVRVWKNSEEGFKKHGRGCCYCFVDTTNGDVLKPASWKGPVKGARGNIYDAQRGVGGVTPYGAARAR